MNAAATVVGLMAVGAVLAARQAPLPAPPQATFKSGVDVIQLDVSVLDKDRHPVRGLTAADFTIFEDGKPRPVASFKAIEIPPTLAATAPWIRDIAPDVAINAPVLGRVILIVIDDASFDQIEPDVPGPLSDIRAISKAREIARTVVRDMGPADVASVIFTDNNYTAQDFTADRARLLKAIDDAALFPGPQTPPPAIESTAPAGPYPEMPRMARMPAATPPQVADWLGNSRGSCYCGLCTADTLARASEMLRELRGLRKTMFFISSGIAYTTTGTPEELPPTRLERICGERRREGTVDLLRQAQRSNVTIHAIDPKGLIVGNGDAQGSDHQMIEFNRTVAETTGGRAVVNNNEPQQQVQGLLDEGASYYLLGFESGSTATDGRDHSLKVRVNRPDVEVISRNSYSTPTVKDVQKLAAKRGAPGSLEDATSGVMPKTDVRLAAALAPFAAADGTPWLAVVVGITEPAAALTGAGAVHETMSVTAHAYGPQGTDKGSAGGSLDLTLVPHGGDAIVFESHLQMPLAPGRYTIRIGARNSGGLSGSVYPSVDVPDFIKAPLTLSGIVLASSPAPVAVPRDAFAATLPVRPTARRTFGDIDEAAAFLRIYQARSRPPAAVTLVARVIDDVNTEVASETAALDASAFGDSHQADFHYALPLDKLAPGEYLLRIDATMASEQSDRTLRFTVK